MIRIEEGSSKITATHLKHTLDLCRSNTYENPLEIAIGACRRDRDVCPGAGKIQVPLQDGDDKGHMKLVAAGTTVAGGARFNGSPSEILGIAAMATGVVEKENQTQENQLKARNLAAQLVYNALTDTSARAGTNMEATEVLKTTCYDLHKYIKEVIERGELQSQISASMLIALIQGPTDNPYVHWIRIAPDHQHTEDLVHSATNLDGEVVTRTLDSRGPERNIYFPQSWDALGKMRRSVNPQSFRPYMYPTQPGRNPLLLLTSDKLGQLHNTYLSQPIIDGHYKKGRAKLTTSEGMRSALNTVKPYNTAALLAIGFGRS